MLWAANDQFLGEIFVETRNSTRDAGVEGSISAQSEINERLSRYLIACIVELKNVYPCSANLSELAPNHDVAELSSKAVRTLCEFNLISMSGKHARLTMQGVKAVQIASASQQQVERALSGRSVSDPSNCILSILRTSFLEIDNGYSSADGAIG